MRGREGGIGGEERERKEEEGGGGERKRERERERERRLGDDCREREWEEKGEGGDMD